MLNSRLSKCNDCESIDRALDRIDEFLSKAGKDMSNNSKYELHINIPTDRIEKLIKYKSILTKRRFNSNYLWKIPNMDIISRVNTLLS